VPPLFCLYLLVLPFIGIMGLVPLFFYAVAVLMQAAVLVPQGGIVQSLCAIPLMVITHVLYGVGFWRGLFTRLKTSGGGQHGNQVQVVLETVPL
jgi:hypothetical protein